MTADGRNKHSITEPLLAIDTQNVTVSSVSVLTRFAY